MKKSVILLFLLLFSTSLVYSETVSPERVQIYYQNGVTYLKDKKYSSAIIELKKVIRQRPYDLTARNTIATAYLSRAKYYVETEKDYKKGINDLRSALVYMKMWDGNERVSEVNIAPTEEKLKRWTNAYAPLKGQESILEEAKSLRADRELAAAIYVYSLLYKDKKYSALAYSSNSDIYKFFNNEKMAIESVRKAISINTKDGMLHFKYAVILDDIGNEDAAMDEYSLALKYSNNNKELLSALENLWMARSVQNPSDSQALINLGAVLQKEGRLDLAKVQYLKARQINPNDPVILINLASLYTQSKEYDNAIRIYDEILSKNPNDLKIRYYKAKLFEEKGDIQTAINEYQAILAKKSDNADAQAALNDILSSMTKEQLTGYLLSEANRNPQSYDAQFKYAYEMHKNQAYLAAIEYYKKALIINPRHIEPYINLAQIYIVQKDYENAENVVIKGLSYFPDSQELAQLKDTADKTGANLLWDEAGSFYQNKQYKEALEKYLKIQYQTPEIYTMIANCYYEIRQYDKAIEYYDKVLQAKPNDENALFMMANILIALKKNDDAKSYLNKILIINPNNNEAKETLSAIKEGEEGKLLEIAISFYENKNYDKAFDTLNAILSVNPKNAYAYYYKGVIFDEKGQNDNAIIEYKKAISNDPSFVLAYYMIAVSLDTKENYKEAVEYYDKYIQSRANENAQDEYLTYAKSRVKELREYLSQN